MSHDHLSVQTLQGELLNEAPILGRPGTLELSNDVLWARDGAGEPFLHAIDVRTGRLLRSVARKGSGPGEFESVFELSRTHGETGAVWAFDLQLQRLTLVDPNEPLGANSRTVQLQGRPRVVRAAWLLDNAIVGVNEFADTRFVFFDSTGTRVGVAAGRLLGDDAAPESERRKATISGFAVCPHPDGRFAIAYSTAGRIELYSRSGGLLDTVSAPYPSQPHFERDDRTRRLQWDWDQDRVWYTDCDVSVQHLYALFAGRRPETYRPEEQTVSRFLHVFSWNDGSLVRVYRLDPPVSDIQVDPTETWLYGSSVATAKLHRYRLPGAP